MFKDIIEDIFSPYSSFGDRIMGLLVLIVQIALAGSLLFLVYILIDTVGLEGTNTTTTTIEHKELVPAHVTTTVMMVGKVPVTQVIMHPKSYRIHFKIDSVNVSTSVSKPYYDSIEYGQKIEVDYGYGRLSGTYQPTAVRSK